MRILYFNKKSFGEISEGFDSKSSKSFSNFLSFSFRSASEVESLLYVALDQTYIEKNEFDELYKSIERIKSLIGGMVRYLSKKIPDPDRIG